jgi:hypothetical protein
MEAQASMISYAGHCVAIGAERQCWWMRMGTMSVTTDAKPQQIDTAAADVIGKGPIR